MKIFEKSIISTDVNINDERIGIKTIAKIIAVVDSENHNLGITVKTIDKELAALNAGTLKEQYTEFCELVAERGKEFGIAVF